MILKDKIVCEGCGKELDYVYVNGYAFGDRVMEGVMFKVRFSENGWICEGVEGREAKGYIKQFDWKYWSGRCEDYCTGNDIAQCPLCGEEVLVEENCDETSDRKLL